MTTAMPTIPETRPPGARKGYSTPKLMRYGDVRLLTQSGTSSTFESLSSPASTTCSNNNARRLCTSDRRAKHNIVKVGTHPMGFGLYLFDYLPAYQVALGAGRQFGVMADEVEAVMPQAVAVQPSGFKGVDYQMLGIRQAPH